MTLADGRYRVNRVSGWIPPFGVTKVIEGRRGCTYLFGIPVGRFDVRRDRFVYHAWPIVDRLDGMVGNRIRGRGRLFGWITFCHFTLARLPG